MSTRWKTYIYPETPLKLFFCKIYNKTSKFLPRFIAEAIGHIILPYVNKAIWEKAAISQGAHMGFIRSLTGVLTLSAYHGKNMIEVLSNADLSKVAQSDIRGEIGDLIHNKKVKYPHDNPTPSVSEFRKNAHKPEKFINLLEQNNIKIIRDDS